MSNFNHIMNIAILLWGCIFCLITAFCIFVGKSYYKNEKRKWLFYMQLSTAVLLGSDALAWLFRGNVSTLGYYMVRISNFLVFALTDLTLFFFQQYIACYLLKNNKQKDKRITIASVITFIGIVFVVISQFTNLYYFFDVQNYYHRNTGYILSVILPLSCMLIDLSLLIQYRKRVSKAILMALSSYIVLPVGAAMFQFLHYGGSVINVAIGCSMIIMFIAAISEQNQEIEQITKSSEIIAERFEISSILNRCVKELSSNLDVDQSINNLMKIINGYFDGDRSYIFELNFKRHILVNTYEYTKGMVSPQKDNLQEVPVEIISVWMESFKKSKPYFISDIEQEKGTDTYEMLKEQDIYRLLAVPLMKEHQVIGFLGVDNPQSHYDDATLLASIQFFITSSLERKKEKEYLEYLSYQDKLTDLYNRNRYIEVIDHQKGKKIYQTGVAYIDLNGLKKINDEKGHEAGDFLIQKVAKTINKVFYGNTYRIGGDEFVVISTEIKEETFLEKMTSLKELMIKDQLNVSIGSLWKEEVNDLEEMMKIADTLMYQEKEAYYRQHGNRYK